MGNPIFRPFFSCIKPWFQRRSHRETAQLVNLLWRQDASGAIKVNQGQSRSIPHSGSCDKPHPDMNHPNIFQKWGGDHFMNCPLELQKTWLHITSVDQTNMTKPWKPQSSCTAWLSIFLGIYDDLCIHSEEYGRPFDGIQPYPVNPNN